MMNAGEIVKDYLQRFCALIEEGEKMRYSLSIIWNSDIVGKDDSKFFTWITNVENLLDAILPEKAAARKDIAALQKDLQSRILKRDKIHARAMGLLLAVKEDFEANLFNLLGRVSNAISIDYLQMAEDLLADKSCKCPSHIPAAVLAGATLEKCLRDKCQSVTPPIGIYKNGRAPKCMNQLITDLCQCGALDKTKAKQLCAWAAIRNDAAHGNVEKLDRFEVEQMIKGVRHFLKGV